MKATTLTTKIERESEKAIMITVSGNSLMAKDWISINFWFPKSQVKISDNGIEVPNWLMASKLAESNCLSLEIGGKFFDKLNFM